MPSDSSPVVRPPDLDETPVAGQQNALFRMRLFNEVAVAATAVGDRRVVPGDAQPSAQSRQHLVAEKAQILRHSQASIGRHRGRHPSYQCTVARLAGSLEDEIRCRRSISSSMPPRSSPCACLPVVISLIGLAALSRKKGDGWCRRQAETTRRIQVDSATVKGRLPF